jgi:hypothetical protein
LSIAFLRWGGVAGLTYVGASVVAIVLGSTPDEGSATDARLLEFYDDSGNQTRVFVASVIAGLATIAFLVFLVALCERLRGVGDRGTPLIRLAYASGVAAIAVDAIGWAVGASAAAALTYSTQLDTLESIDAVRVLLILGHHTLAGLSGVLAAPLVFAVSLEGRRRELLPRSLTWAGYVISILLLPAQLIFGITPGLLLLWIAAMGIWLLRAGAGEPGGQPNTVTP